MPHILKPNGSMPVLTNSEIVKRIMAADHHHTGSKNLIDSTQISSQLKNSLSYSQLPSVLFAEGTDPAEGHPPIGESNFKVPRE